MAGTFAYLPAAGTILAAGAQSLSVTFTPQDTADYTTASASVTITVNPAAGNPPPVNSPAGNSVSHVYAATYPSTTYGYSVAANGQLTPIAGFPLATNIQGVISGKYLFASNADGVHIDTYLIGSDGSLTRVQTYDDTQASQAACGKCTPGLPQLADPSGSSLYATAGYLDGGDYNAFLETFRIDPSTGTISYVSTGIPVESRDWGIEFGSFSENETYLYGTNFTSQNTEITFVNRAQDGSLSAPSNSFWDNIYGLTPPFGSPGSEYYTLAIGTDTSNHLAAVVQNWGRNEYSPAKLVSFTINSDGTLTTTNANADMPLAPSWWGSVSPDGKLIAMALKNGGFQIFNFNGAAPVSVNTGVIPTDSFVQLAWDNHYHLFALSASTLYVFNVTAASIAEAPGSPYNIGVPTFLMVQP